MNHIKVDRKFYDLAAEAAKMELSDDQPISKGELWTQMGTELEIAGYPASEISVRIADAIELGLEKKLGYRPSIKTAYYYRIMAKHQWSDNKQKRITKETLPVTPLGGKHDNSYKGEIKDDLAIRALTDVKKLASFCIAAMRKSEEPYCGTPELDALWRDVSAITKITKAAADGKTTVPPTTHTIFAGALRLEAGMFGVATVFLQQQLKMVSDGRKFLSSKQAGKFRRAMEPNQIPLLQPKNRDEAVFMGFYGLSCQNAKCRSWRVTESTELGAKNLQCATCHHTFDGYTVTRCSGMGGCGKLFYVEDLAEIIKTGQCPSCDKKHTLPLALVRYVESAKLH